MSGRTWVYSDPHFYHKNIVKFTKEDGTPLRPWDDAEQMTEDLIAYYNELVDDGDRVYILGDVAFKSSDMHRVIPRLKGRKCLIPGNHEPTGMRKYFDLFDDVRGYVQRNGFIMSHIPIHPGSLGRWGLNIHGHLHANEVMRKAQSATICVDDTREPDPRYYCACVERTDFRPKLLDDILKERGLV